MQHFKDSVTGKVYGYEDDVEVVLTNGIRTFSKTSTVHHPASIVHHEATFAEDGVTELSPAYDETVQAFDTVENILFNTSATLEPISDADLANIRAAAAALMPKPSQFIEDVKSAFGGISGIVSIAGLATLFFSAVNAQDWNDVQLLVIGTHAANTITDTQYSAIKAAATANNIPIVLP